MTTIRTGIINLKKSCPEKTNLHTDDQFYFNNLVQPIKCAAPTERMTTPAAEKAAENLFFWPTTTMMTMCYDISFRVFYNSRKTNANEASVRDLLCAVLTIAIFANWNDKQAESLITVLPNRICDKNRKMKRCSCTTHGEGEWKKIDSG